MTTTPLFTADELAAHIAAYKTALLALATAEEYTIALPDGSRTTVRRSQLPQLREHLSWLQAQKVEGAVGHGPQFVQGRVYRG